MNKTLYLRLLKYGTTFVLGSCAQMPQTQPSTPIQPLFRVSNSLGSAYGSYLLGTYYAGQNRSEKAAEAYRQAIQLEPDMAEARNALAMLNAEQGRYDAAISDLLIAVRAAPKAAKYHNNLGYVYHLNGDYTGAVNEFRNALTLDPHHALASNNLQASCDKMSVVAQRHLVWLAQGKARLGDAGPCAAPRLTDRSGGDAEETLLNTALAYLRRGVAMVGGLPKSVNFSPAADVAPEKTVVGPAESANAFRLEIANGNGIAGMGRRVRDALHLGDSPAPRLTNLKSFTQRDTFIHYRAGFDEAARQLSLTFPSHPRIANDVAIGPAVDVRLVLGKDLTAGAEMAIKKYPASQRYARGASMQTEPILGEIDARTIARK